MENKPTMDIKKKVNKTRIDVFLKKDGKTVRKQYRYKIDDMESLSKASDKADKFILKVENNEEYVNLIFSEKSKGNLNMNTDSEIEFLKMCGCNVHKFERDHLCKKCNEVFMENCKKLNYIQPIDTSKGCIEHPFKLGYKSCKLCLRMYNRDYYNRKKWTVIKNNVK